MGGVGKENLKMIPEQPFGERAEEPGVTMETEEEGAGRRDGYQSLGLSWQGGQGMRKGIRKNLWLMTEP